MPETLTTADDGKTFHVGDPVRYVNWPGETYTVGRVEAILSASYQLVAVLLDGSNPICAPIDEFETLLCDPPTGFRRLRAHWGTRPSDAAWA